MIATRARTPSLARSRPSIAHKARNSVTARAEGGFDVDKFVEGLPAPVEYCYAGAAWGFTILTWSTPLNFIGKTVALLHLLCALTSVARLGAIARPDQATGESEAAKAFGKGLLIGPFNVGWLGVDRFKK